MHGYSFFVSMVTLSLLIPCQVYSDVDKDSVFRDARKPASMLDVELALIQRTWWTNYVLHPEEAVKLQFPNIAAAGMGIELEYSNNDTIIAKGKITNLPGFLKLSLQQRKSMIKNTLRNLRVHLLGLGTIVDKQTGKETGRSIENRHIVLNIIIEDVTTDTNNESILLSLPQNVGTGQAGYANGYFVFSKPYYLDFKVKNNKAVAGDRSLIEIEKEE